MLNRYYNRWINYKINIIYYIMKVCTTGSWKKLNNKIIEKNSYHHKQYRLFCGSTSTDLKKYGTSRAFVITMRTSDLVLDLSHYTCT